MAVLKTSEDKSNVIYVISEFFFSRNNDECSFLQYAKTLYNVSHTSSTTCRHFHILLETLIDT